MTSDAPIRLRTRDLVAAGQSPWLDFIRRDMLTSGELAAMVRDGLITGLTSNPTIFEKALAGSTQYDAQLAGIAARGRINPYDAFVEVAADDIRGAADALRPVFDATGGKDGHVSFELPPAIANDTAATIAEGKRLFALLGRPNVMIKVPGTPEGIAALPALIADGVNVNITLLFAVGAYESAAHGYIEGLERRLAEGLPLSTVAGCASFFVSRVDTSVDAQLPQASGLHGRAAVANARHAYRRFQEIFSGPRWERLETVGARPQRPLWASTGTKNPAYSDVLYVETLVAPHTVNTMPEATLSAVNDHLDIRPMTAADLADAAAVLASLPAAGIDLTAVTDRLLAEGLASFAADFDRLLARIQAVLAAVRSNPVTPPASIAAVGSAVDARLARLDAERIVARAWDGDHTAWSPDPTELADRLGWLHLPARMRQELPALRDWADAIAAEGYRHAVLLGMGGSSLAPEVIREVNAVAPGMLELLVLDTTDPVQMHEAEQAIDLERTIFIVSSKSGGTIETRSQFDYFWEKHPRGASYAVVTDQGSPLEELARERGARQIFLNPTDIGGRYSALSFYGLVPAALIGADLDALIDGADAMASACGPLLSSARNPGALLGAVMGEAALADRNKLTLILPDGFSSLGVWIEQLVAESTGKHGKGILPVDGEPVGPPSAYGPDRLFVAIGGHPMLDELEMAGHPVVRLPYLGQYDLGGEFFRWEFATAIAGQVLGINPFDQPNVQEAKDATNAVLAGDAVDGTSPPVEAVLATVGPGDYLALLAYLPRNAQTITDLAAIRAALRDRLRVPVTVGFGPRYLHSTGQLHKGGPANGVFIQVVTEDPLDLEVPGKPYTFGQLKAAQALGDLASLRDHGRRVARVHLRELLEIATRQ